MRGGIWQVCHSEVDLFLPCTDAEHPGAPHKMKSMPSRLHQRKPSLPLSQLPYFQLAFVRKPLFPGCVQQDALRHADLTDSGRSGRSRHDASRACGTACRRPRTAFLEGARLFCPHFLTDQNSHSAASPLVPRHAALPQGWHGAGPAAQPAFDERSRLYALILGRGTISVGSGRPLRLLPTAAVLRTDAANQRTNQQATARTERSSTAANRERAATGRAFPPGQRPNGAEPAASGSPHHYRARDSLSGVSRPSTAPHAPHDPTRDSRLTSHRRCSARPRPARPRLRLGGAAGRPLTAVPQGGLRAAGVYPPGRYPTIRCLNLPRVF